MTLWKATGRCRICHPISQHFAATLQVSPANSDGCGSERTVKICGEISSLRRPPSSFFSVPFSNLSTSHFVWLSHNSTPPHSEIPLPTRSGVFRNTSYLPVQKVTTVYSIDIIFQFLILTTAMHNYLCFHPSVSSRHSSNHFTVCGRSACRCSRAIILFICLLLGT